MYICGRNLRPGGAIEQVELDWEFRGRNDTMADDSVLRVWSRKLHEAMTLAGVPIKPDGVGQCLEEAGFVDIRHETFDTHCNSGHEPPEFAWRARWLNLGLTCASEGMTLVPFMRYLGWQHEDVCRIVGDFESEINTINIISYCTMLVDLPRCFYIAATAVFLLTLTRRL